jgi:hypothetical protein
VSKQYHEETRLSSDKRVNFATQSGSMEKETHWIKRCSFPQEIAVAGGVQRRLKSPLFTFSAPSGRSLVTFWRARK